MRPHSFTLIAILAFAWNFLGISHASSAPQKPNILLVVADDLGYTDIGSYGGEIDTPNLDALALQGMKFTDFHASVSCSPTRSMLLSGNDNHVAGLGNMGELLTDNQKGKPGYEGHLNERVASLAEVLRSGGYHTYMAGKWHLGHEKGSLPFDRGFERSFSMLVGGASHWSDMLGILPSDDPAKYSLDGKHLNSIPTDHYSSRSYADFLMKAIRKNRGDGKPFLAYLAFQAVHDPVQVPEPWLSKYSGQYDDGYEALKAARWQSAKDIGVVPKKAKLADRHPLIKPWQELSEDKRAVEARGMEVYAGMLDAMDYHFGRVLNFLKDIGEYENTIIIFLSDNGANPWYSNEYPGADKPEFRKQFDYSLDNIGNPGSNHAYGIGFASASDGPLDKFKMTVSEGGIRVPLLIAGPGIKKGQQNDAFTYVWDIMPTILDMAGVKYPAQLNDRKIEVMRGRSMIGLLDSTKEAIYNPGEFVGGEMGNGKWMRQGDFKAVVVPKPYGTSEWKLFNVEDDLGEANDLSKKLPEKLQVLKAAWEKYASDVGVIPPE
ncbi:MAG: sulfatase-like hydrolase/transferase [Methyloprofundus sp.]|nr:sulfatase-like hydrolase/transferase [Methyloprofundus sp.]